MDVAGLAAASIIERPQPVAGRGCRGRGDPELLEKAVTDAQLLLISAQADYFFAVADYRAALAMDPLSSP